MKKTTSYYMLMLILAIITSLGNIYAQSCPEGLVSYWKMDETNGNTFVDLAGGNDATLHNFTVNPVTGKVDGANFFTFTDGINAGEGQYATAPDNDIYSFPAGSGFTISYWLKFTETQYGLYGGQDHLIISKGDWGDGGPSTAFWASGVNGSGFVSFMLRDNTDEKRDLEGRVYGQDNFDDGQWHHVACVRNSVTNYSMIYVDGRITDQQYDEFQDDWDNSAPIYIGSLTNGSPQYFYWGSMDELAVFNRALTKAEIDEIRANADLGTGLCNLIASPNFNSDPVTKANVGSAYSYTAHAKGTQTGMTYSLISKPSGMSINASTGAITWTPASIDIDAYVQIKADNGIAPADTQSFRIYLSEGGADCPSGLLTLHRLDETSGTTYADVQESHHAVVAPGYDAPTPTTGIIGGAQTFSETTGINIPDNGNEFDWAVNASFSLESWFKTTETGKAVLARNRTEAFHATSWWIGVSPEGYGIMELRDNAATNTVLKGTTVINDGEWHHVVGVRDGVANQNRVYVDGVLENTLNQVFVDDFVVPVSLVVSIGYLTPWEGGESELHMIGSIDETAIYNKALTGAEVTSFYNNGNPSGHCTNSNYAPVFISTPKIVATEDAPYSYSMIVDDINTTDTLTLSAYSKPSWLNFNWTKGSKTATLSGNPANDHVGSHNITLRVTDGHIVRNQTFTITVANSQDAPVVTSSPVVSVNRGAVYNYDLEVADVDASDIITMTVVTKPSWMSFNWTPGSKTATLSGTPGNGNIGANPVDISISDGHVTINHQFTVNVIQTNLAPVISGQVALSVNEDESLAILKSNFSITDTDNQQSEITIKVRPGTNYTFSGNTITPAHNFNGQITVNVRAYDLYDSSEVFPAIVTVNAVFDGPVITSIPDTIVAAGNPYIYIFTATVPAGSTLTKSVLIIPDWLEFNETSGLISGLPGLEDIGKHTVLLKATDGNLNVYQQFKIDVREFVSISETTGNEFVLYPVPATNELNIRFNNLYEETTIDIINSSGSIVETMIVPANTNLINIPTEKMDAGFYICHFRNNTINLTSRFLIVK